MKVGLRPDRIYSQCLQPGLQIWPNFFQVRIEYELTYSLRASMRPRKIFVLLYRSEKDTIIGMGLSSFT